MLYRYVILQDALVLGQTGKDRNGQEWTRRDKGYFLFSSVTVVD